MIGGNETNLMQVFVSLSLPIEATVGIPRAIYVGTILNSANPEQNYLFHVQYRNIAQLLRKGTLSPMMPPKHYVMGKEAMYELRNADILISGMHGLGVEIAKNLILSGVKSVIVHDCNNVDYKDLSLQYYFSESDIGQNRAEVAKEKLSELNNNVNMTYSSSNIDEDFLQKHKVNVFVLTDGDINNQVKIGDYCHEHGIKFVNANTKGLFG
ncbi:unnamed protein product [Rotaria sordida]|uniref:SUMO-activating enzyme subunit 1 n=2 Tax=Rotaria sordida TaxID=392033 RepID=A0A819MR29_9BILA|nr:unnamed protein product [Rotaria sordida]